MNSALYIGATGLKTHAEGMNVVSNNLANVSTVGFKQQSIQFSDIFYASQGAMGGWWNSQQDSCVALGQTGMGAQVDSVRTLFTQGGYESSNTFSDMSISGKGYFQVSDKNGTFYTRAGDFRFDEQGFLKLPAGQALNGYKLDSQGNKGALGPIQVDPYVTMPGKATSTLNLNLNLGLTDDSSSSADNPYFGLLQAWDGTKSPPLSSSAYGYKQSMDIYDAEGKAQTVSVYFDGAPDSLGGKTVEFVVAADPADPEKAAAGDGLLMSGTLRFDSTGQLVDMSAFAPTGGDKKDLASWTPASLSGGVPQFTLNGQAISLDLGIQSKSGGWENAPASAAEVGTEQSKLASMGSITKSSNSTTGYKKTSADNGSNQNGYSEGMLNDLSVKGDGTVVGTFSNGQSQSLYEIPVCRFVSEDGLRREGGNMFSATNESGPAQVGKAGTENYGTVIPNSLELSNVDMAREMVNMIVTQRGFQSNSKAITTADAMLQKAIELKR